ncbi:MAG: gephyrin-like molybdotransferase Glp [Chloroflexota bacterium]
MPEFFNVLPPAPALAELFKHLPAEPRPEQIATADALDRVTAAPILSPSSLPAFPRSTMDGYAVRAQNTFGASATLPAYLAVIGEVPMGGAPALKIEGGQAALVHTGGMIPDGADAVVIVEHTQTTRENEIEVNKAVAVGENTLRVGEDVSAGDGVIEPGVRLRPQELGALMALGVVEVIVARRPRFAILATGDEIVPPDSDPAPGQIRDINSYSVSGVIQRAGGVPLRYGIAPDNFEKLLAVSTKALSECDGLILSAGSSVSVRDMTGEVINRLGKPGVLIHGVAVKPGKPTLLAACDGKPVFGLPGNPVSALVIAGLFVQPTIERMLGLRAEPHRIVRAKLTRNVASEAGREDYVPAKLVERGGELFAEPIFGKSNLIFTLVRADGLICIPLNANGVSEGEVVEVKLF